MPTLEAGQTFDRYHILSWLGSGTSGESYEAEDSMLLRKVTLKLIYPQDILPDSARRHFFREMQIISGLNHPFISPVLDYGEINGRLYVARSFVSSGSLLGAEGRLWFRPPLNVRDAIRYAHQVAWALHAIHARGSLHGGVTFTNLLVLRGPNLDNQPDYAPFLLADAGLAQFVRRFGQNLKPLLPVSAAPEQIGGRVTPASDQFALAVLLYTWLTARPPFIGTPEEVEHLKLSQTLSPLSTFNPRVTIEQDGIVLRALSVLPEDRYPTILAFADALLNTITDQAPSAAISEASKITVKLAVPDTDAQPTPETGTLSTPTTPQPAAQNTSSPARARVVIVSPYADDPLEVSLENEEITIGRAGSSDILLDYDNLTSRHHALFRREDGRYLLYDRLSANGVFVNGQKISSDQGFPLTDGDHISIGNYELIFRTSLIDQAHVPPANDTAQEAHHASVPYF